MKRRYDLNTTLLRIDRRPKLIITEAGDFRKDLIQKWGTNNSTTDQSTSPTIS